MNNTTEFVFGSELQGNGKISKVNVVIGVAIALLATVGIILGIANLYYIKTVKIFHNAFGWFWASRTVGEMLMEIENALYIGPVTATQLRNIPTWLGISPYVVVIIGSVSACCMHGVIALNRNMAVFKPLHYSLIFSKTNSFAIIAFSWVSGVLVVPLFFVFPCNVVGYSPQQYTYIFLKCYAGQERDFSYVGTVINHFCLTLCVCTVLIDISTLIKIIHIRVVLKTHKNDRMFNRNVRFFMQSAFQNVIMVTTLVVLVQRNYQNIPQELLRDAEKALNLTEVFTLIFTHIANPLSLLLFNPEIRRRLFARAGVDVQDTNSNPNNSQKSAPSPRNVWQPTTRTIGQNSETSA
ncbi:hypothetical protein QR680_016231 [Steinernema hermaphroditum]|uniref:7TM GPCR serpentine receptor class x (Srx) domain-containing protein n=1 Tax=Steinernema hermaphroditum TaxID=289476 RepID=A0AA39HCN7_9BILA|nr:hypothetical protein QR680_016231 [Steinernema hermaphroditum]